MASSCTCASHRTSAVSDATAHFFPIASLHLVYKLLRRITNLDVFCFPVAVPDTMAKQISSFGPDASAGACRLFEYVLSLN